MKQVRCSVVAGLAPFFFFLFFYLWCGELHFWVVFNLPQSLIESFPLVGLGILVFVGQVREDVFGAEKCAVGGETLNI